MNIRRSTDYFRVLLAEDNPEDVYCMRQVAHKAVPRVLMHVATDGEEVIDYLGGFARRPDRGPLPSLILLDIRLPKRSGLDVLAWIRARGEFIRIPVVMVTGSTDAEDIPRALSLGANSFLVKPARLDALQEMVQSLVCYWSGLNQTGGFL